MIQVALILPLGAGFLYACAAVSLTKALGTGVPRGWVNLLCSVSMGLRCLGMYTSIGDRGSATVTNIPYGSRCLWSGILVRIPDSVDGFPLPIRRGDTLMWRRLGGAILLFTAMALVLL